MSFTNGSFRSVFNIQSDPKVSVQLQKSITDKIKELQRKQLQFFCL